VLKFAHEFTNFILGCFEDILLTVLDTVERLDEFIEDVVRSFVQQPSLCVMCEVLLYVDYYVARKI